MLAACTQLPFQALIPTPRPTLAATAAPAPDAQPTPDRPSTPAPTDAPALPFAPLTDGEVVMAALRPESGMAPEKTDDLTRYRMVVELAPDFSQVTGQAQIRYTNREQKPLDIVYLHLFPNLWDGGLQATNVLAAGQPVAATLPSGDDILGVPLPAPLAPGASIDLSLDFAIDIPAGDGVGNYGEFAYQDGILALAHFYPTMAVYDTDWRLETPSSQGDVIYHDASLYDVTFIAPEGLKVVATGATLDQKALGGGRTAWRLAGGPMRDFNIVASRDYEEATRQVRGVEVNSYYLPQDRAGGETALGFATDALRDFEEAFGRYPYRELDVVSTATEAGGIEYPGMIVVARGLYDSEDPTGFFQAATAHEVAHQWWYNVVGNDQVNSPWLDEALAQYATYLYYGARYGQSGYDGFEKSLQDRWERVGLADKPIGLPVGDYQDKEYGAIVYGRGPLFLLALRDEIGDEEMAELLKQHYAENRWDIATTEGFQALAEEVSGKDLDALFNEWVTAKPRGN
jgi:hypothetical protein